MSKWNVTLKATIEIDDPQTLDQLIIARLYEDKTGVEVCDYGPFGDGVKKRYYRSEFNLLEYPDDWLNFTEVIE